MWPTPRFLCSARPNEKQDGRLILRANAVAHSAQNFGQHRNATGLMSLSSVGAGRLEVGRTFASALFSGPSLSKEWSLSPFCTFARD
jgi:hypothetical protein